MSSVRKVFQPLEERELKLLKRIAKAINNNDLDYARNTLSKMPDEALLNLLCNDGHPDDFKNVLETIFDFCSEDEVLQKLWKTKLFTKFYFTESIASESGEQLSLFEHHLGLLSYHLYLGKDYNREDKKRGLDLSCSFYNYHGLLAKAKSMLASAESNGGSLDLAIYTAITSSLGEYYWSLGHLQAYCLLDKIEKYFPLRELKEEAESVDAKDLIVFKLEEFHKAKSLLTKEASGKIYATLRGKTSVEDFMQEIFGLRSIPALEVHLSEKYPQEFPLALGQANKELQGMEEVNASQDEMKETNLNEISLSEEMKKMDLIIAKLKKDSKAISSLLKHHAFIKSIQPPAEEGSVNVELIKRDQSPE